MMKNTPVTEADADNVKRTVKWRSFLLPIALIVCLFTVILATELGHVGRTTAAVHDEMYSRLQANARLIDGKIEDMYESVESLAPLMAYGSGLTKQQMILAMNALRDAHGFDFVVRTNTDGIAMNYLGKENIDLSQRAYIHKALSGTRAIEFVSAGAYDTGSSYIIMCVPIVVEGEVEGAFHASFKTRNFVSLLADIAMREGQGCDEISIISSDGTVIASSSESFDETEFKTLSESVKEKQSASGTHYLTYDGAEGKRYYYFSALDAGTRSDWLIVSRMEKDYLSSQTSFVVISAIALLAVAMGITAALLCIVISRQRLMNELEKRSAMLAKALDAAESAGRAKSRFLSTVSHEMRTPLNAIIGFVELAKDATGEQAVKYIANTQIASKQLLSVINDVLDMSSIESGKMAIGHAPFDFRQLIHSVTNIYVAQCFDKGIKYETKLLTPIDEWLVGDQLRVNQILINLLGNAVKFTSAGHVWLSISETRSSEDKVFVRFEVADTGCGMSEEMQTRLFKPFEQENSATARKYGGSGLGLSIVKNLAGLMGGAISVKSAPGEGSVFTVDIPFSRCVSALGQQNEIFARELRVLVVDDEEMEREYISAVLTRMGARFTCVPDCEAALAQLDNASALNDPFGICLVDWRMPGTDGRETTKRIRARYGSDVIVIVVSAYDHNQANENAIDAGANLFIPKPLFQSALFDLFMTLTGGRFSKSADALETYDFSGRRVLLAEDNEMNQIVTEGLLAKMGAQCDIAGDGREAVDMFCASEAGYYDAILMDVQMPVLNGLEAVKEIRASKRPEAKTVQIIALTANAFDEDVSRALSAGMNAHVSKPIEMEEFAKALNSAFEQADKTRT